MGIPRTEKVCVICECEKSIGIYLYRSFICEDCEKDILLTDTDNPKYIFFLEQLKKTNILHLNK